MHSPPALPATTVCAPPGRTSVEFCGNSRDGHAAHRYSPPRKTQGGGRNGVCDAGDRRRSPDCVSRARIRGLHPRTGSGSLILRTRTSRHRNDRHLQSQGVFHSEGPAVAWCGFSGTLCTESLPGVRGHRACVHANRLQMTHRRHSCKAYVSHVCGRTCARAHPRRAGA